MEGSLWGQKGGKRNDICNYLMKVKLPRYLNVQRPPFAGGGARGEDHVLFG